MKTPKRKRTTLHVSHEIYEMLTLQAKKENKSIDAYLVSIFNEIAAGKHDKLITDNTSFRSVAAGQNEAKKAIDHLKNKNVRLVEAVSSVIISRESLEEKRQWKTILEEF